VSGAGFARIVSEKVEKTVSTNVEVGGATR
jgi:hypothetical protein